MKQVRIMLDAAAMLDALHRPNEDARRRVQKRLQERHGKKATLDAGRTFWLYYDRWNGERFAGATKRHVLALCLVAAIVESQHAKRT